MYLQYVNLLHSFHRGTLGIHWYIAQDIYHTFSMSIWFRRSFKTCIFSRFFKVAIATSNFMTEIYNGGLAPEFSVSRWIVIRQYTTCKLLTYFYLISSIHHQCVDLAAQQQLHSHSVTLRHYKYAPTHWIYKWQSLFWSLLLSSFEHRF